MTTESQCPPTLAVTSPERTTPRRIRRPDSVYKEPEPPPGVGDTFLGFRLQEEIGRGAFSHVYLARQQDMADRPVVVKVTTDARRESDALARLQHPNVVPIYSVHRSGSYSAVCMPYLGTTTLADVYRGIEGMPTLPNSGKDLFTTLNTRRGSTVVWDTVPAQISGAGPAPVGPAPLLTSLDGLSYVEAVLWLAARLADGLAHAHNRGVIHRDLKPANVLLSDDGVPMILDFNLAGDCQVGPDAGARGGTPPYMSPEQLERFAGQPRKIDARTDLYSLGVLVYELLTRRSPFPRYKATDPEALKAMTADRQGPPPRVRQWNKAVSHAAEAIVRRLLEPDPEKRYRTAQEVVEDIERHLADRPLEHAAEPSVGERVGKWRRRNRSLVAATGLVTLAVAAVGTLAAGSIHYGGRLARMEAAEGYRQFRAEAQAAEAMSFDRPADRGRLDDGARACEATLSRYHVLDRDDWRDGGLVTELPAEDRERLRQDVARLLFLLARSTAEQATLDAGRADPQPRLRRALALNGAALACDGGPGPAAVWEQRAEITRLLGRSDEARLCARQAENRQATGWSDRLLLAYHYAGQRDYRKAAAALRVLTAEEPGEFAAWYARGVCHLELSQDGEAVGCFTTCVALRPDHLASRSQSETAARRLRPAE